MRNVHYEACLHLNKAVQQIKEESMKACFNLNPANPICLHENIIRDVDMVLRMSVNPGFGGQKFIENSIDKIKTLKELILRKGSNALIEVDGGVNLETGKRLAEAGADILVAGNAVFKSDNPVETIKALKTLK